MSCAKTAEPIEMPLVVWTRVDLRNHAFGGSPDPQDNGHLGGAASPGPRSHSINQA